MGQCPISLAADIQKLKSWHFRAEDSPPPLAQLSFLEFSWVSYMESQRLQGFVKIHEKVTYY